MSRRTALALAFVFASSLLPCLAPTHVRAERVRSFDVQMRMDGQDTFVVTERIRYDFEGQRRRGIFRDVLVKYGRGRAADYRIDLDVLSVTDAQGNDRPYKLFSQGKARRIRVGRADRYLSGLQDYWITYRVRRGVLYFDSHDEIYWNVTGTDWEVPIESASARFELPEGIGDGDVAQVCFTGRQGSVQRNCSIERRGNVVEVRTDGSLRAREGLTFAVSLPKGVLVEPTRWERLRDRLGDYLSAWILLPFVALAGMFGLWKRYGRDPRHGESIVTRYEPPEGLTPAEVGMVIDEKVDTQDVTSTILDLAVRGFLKIEAVDRDRFLFLSTRDYILVQVAEKKSAVAQLKSHERVLYDAIFRRGSRVKTSELRDEFYTDLKRVVDEIRDEMSGREGHFPSPPHGVRGAWRVLGVVGMVGGLVLGQIPGVGLAGGVAVGLSGFIVLCFAGAMPRRSARGREAQLQALGFQEFLVRVDKDRLERMGGYDRETFESVLPYAVVLGAADQWADAFDDIYREPPDWYRSSGYGDVFHPRIFVEDVGRSLSTMGQAMTSRPKSSGSGSSAFGGGGGGGFSGGGFGGGGGGSW